MSVSRPSSRIGAIVLAAGQSSRMGRNKLLMPLRGKPLVRHAVEAAAGSSASPVIVVTGHDGKAVAAALDGLQVCPVENGEFSMGLSTSLKCGLRTLATDCEGAAILLGDMPFITHELIDALIASFDPIIGRTICVPTRKGRRGNPVLWSNQLFPEMLALEGNSGAKSLMARHEDLIYELEAMDDCPLIDIDTLEALARYQV